MLFGKILLIWLLLPIVILLNFNILEHINKDFNDKYIYVKSLIKYTYNKNVPIEC